jgi:hypothetical protein
MRRPAELGGLQVLALREIFENEVELFVDDEKVPVDRVMTALQKISLNRLDGARHGFPDPNPSHPVTLTVHGLTSDRVVVQSGSS